LKNWHDLEDYAQIETTESFYILQNLVNRHLFGHQFQDYARLADGASAMPITEQLGFHDTEISPRIRLDLPTVCRHFPWWQLGRVAKQRFNIVTTNASLTEFSEGAFRQYAWLIDQCLAPDGCLLVQCHGGGPGSLEKILRTFFAIKLAPVALVVQPGATSSEKFFATSNFLFVREQHPLFSKYAQATQLPGFDPNDVLARAVYGVGNGPRREVSPEEIVEMVTQRMASHAARKGEDQPLLRSIA
jgi:hypothetical protein